MVAPAKNVLPKFSVKELADRLHVAPVYVYRMRAAGFTMPWDPKMKCFAATEEEARKWIEVMGFRVVRGKWRLGAPGTPSSS